MRIQKFSLVKNLLLAVLFSAGSLSAELTESQRGWLAGINRPLRIATYEGFVPLSFSDRDGKTVGILPDFSNWMAEEYGMDIELVPVAADQIKEGVRSGKFDAAFIYTSRLQDESLTGTAKLFGMVLSVYAPVDSPLNTLDDLAGRVVAVEPYSTDLLKTEGCAFDLLICATFDEMMEAVRKGQADAFMSGSIPVDYNLSTGRQSGKLRPVGRFTAKGKIFLCTRADSQMLSEILDIAVAESDQQGIVQNLKLGWRIYSGTSLRGFVARYSRHIIIAIGILFLAVLLFWLWDARLTSHIQKKTRELRSSEERLRSIFQNSPDAIFIESEEGIVLDANPKACSFHGLSYDEMVGKNVLELVPENHRESVKRDFPKWFTGELKRCEGVSMAAGGREIPVEMIGSALRYEGQTAVLLLVRDIAERRRVEEALRESENRYRGLIEVQSSFIARLDRGGRFTFVNEALCRFLGRNRAELIGELIDPFLNYADLDLFRQAMTNLISQKKSVESDEYRMRSKKQMAWVHWETTAIFDETGRVVEVQSVGRDVTEKRRTREALQESEKRLRFLFEEISHIAVQGYNEDHEIIFWNPASEKLYGYSRDEALGKKIEDLVVPANQRSDVKNSIDQWVKSSQPLPSGEMTKMRADGQPISVFSSRLATWNQSGERELYVIDIDLSELKRASDQLVEAKELAERSNRAKSEFLANMSHEIRTPMNGVMGMTSLLLDTELTSKQRDLTQTIMDSTNDLLIILNELLDISRIEAGEVRLQMEPFSPRETVEKVINLFAERAGKKEVDLSVAVHPAVPEKMMGDPGRIRQVLINLVGNALKFTRNGHIQIRMQVEKVEAGWNLIADVKDTGVGMSPELQKKVFDKFTQGDTSSTREHGGAGLGLAITKQLVNLMGGEISVSSEEGRGTTFEFNVILPPLEEPKPAARSVPANNGSDELSAEILLVEDNLVNQKVAAAMIKKIGCVVTAANNGAEALKMIPDKHFDLIFMDCQMPILDGFKTTRAIREMVGEISEIPIVAMTAHALKEDRQRCLDAGMDDYLTKPVDRSKLLAVLQKYCG